MDIRDRIQLTHMRLTTRYSLPDTRCLPLAPCSLPLLNLEKPYEISN
jgi:hypothetical protein